MMRGGYTVLRESGGVSGIRGLEGDHGEGVFVNLVRTEGGDVGITLQDRSTGQFLSVTFAGFHGGSRNPVVARKLGELMEELGKAEGG